MNTILRPGELPSVDRGAGVRTTHLVGADIRAASFTNGITEFDSGASLPLHSHNCQESVLVLEGEAVFEDEDGEHAMRPGDTTLVSAGSVHRFSNPGPGRLRIFWVYGSAAPTRTIAETGETRPVRGERP